jgi:hypothetical protein
MARFRSALARLCSEKHIPPGLVGDLADLLFTLEDLVRQLTEFAFQTEPKWKQRRRQFHEIEISLDEQLRMTLEDVLPAMKKVRRRLYRMKKKPSSKDPHPRSKPARGKAQRKPASARRVAGK